MVFILKHGRNIAAKLYRPSVLHRLFLNLGNTDGKIHTTESTSGLSSASELTCIPAMRSCITALHYLISRVEDSMARKETALVVLS